MIGPLTQRVIKTDKVTIPQSPSRTCPLVEIPCQGFQDLGVRSEKNAISFYRVEQEPSTGQYMELDGRGYIFSTRDIGREVVLCYSCLIRYDQESVAFRLPEPRYGGVTPEYLDELRARIREGLDDRPAKPLEPYRPPFVSKPFFGRDDAIGAKRRIQELQEQRERESIYRWEGLETINSGSDLEPVSGKEFFYGGEIAGNYANVTYNGVPQKPITIADLEASAKKLSGSFEYDYEKMFLAQGPSGPWKGIAGRDKPSEIKKKREEVSELKPGRRHIEFED